VLWIVVPSIALPGLAAVHVAIEIVVLIEIIVVVDIDVPAVVPIAVAPVATPSAPSGCTQRDSRAPHQSCAWHIAWIGIGIVRVFNRSGSIHDGRIVRGHINDVRVRLLNFDYLLTAGDCLRIYYGLGSGF
jgi:hypothetical protein